MDNPTLQTSPNAARRLSADRLVEALRGQIATIEGARRKSGTGLLFGPTEEQLGDGPNLPAGKMGRSPSQATVSTGCEALDRLLPGHGFRRGTLVEWLAAEPGGGAATLAFYAAREAARQGGVLVVLDRAGEFYPPAAIRLGIAIEKLLVVQAVEEAETTWALDQALRCPAVAAAVAWPERLDDRTFRRLQLASEEGGTLGLLVRPQAARAEPSWADVRLGVEPLPASAAAARRLRIQVLRCRGSAAGGSVEVEIDDETRPVHLASPLVDPTARRRAARA